MALETNIREVPLVQGQDEGTQVEVLPLGRLSALQNARHRRMGRLGKRNGYTALASTDATATALGNGGGRLACLGPRFCAVDDRFYRWDDVAGAWGYPALAGGALDESRLLNRWPQFVPAPTFSPASEQSPLNLYTSGVGLGGVMGTLLQSVGSVTYAQGLIWCSWCYWAVTPTLNAWTVVVTATDPASGVEVFRQAIPLSGATTDNQQPFLLSVGNGTVVLVTDHFTAGAKDGLRLMICTNRSAGFNPGAMVTVACVESAVNYYQGSNDEILIAWVESGTPTDVRIGRWSVTTQSFAATGSRNTAGNGNASKLSCYGFSGGTTWVGYFGSIMSRLAVDIFNSALGGVIGNLDSWNSAFTPDPVGPMVFCRVPGSSPLAVLALAQMAAGGTAVVGFSETGLAGNRYLIVGSQHISQPFECDAGVYVWMRHVADSQLGVATLVRIPLETEYERVFLSACPPIEATLDDEDIDLLTPASSGPPFSTPIATPLGYVMLLTPTVESIVTTGPTTYFLRKPLIVPVRHRSEGILHSNSSVTEVCGKHFVAGGQPMFVDARGAVEAGFVQSPKQPVLVASLGGGGLVDGAAYQYTAYYESIDANGLIERSAPCAPLVIPGVGGVTRYRVRFNALELSKKPVRLRIFRTLANQTQFFQLIVVDVTACVNAAADGSSTIVIEDNAADDIVGSNTPLYTQLGSEFENSQFPACRFSMVAAGRLWVGGGFKGNVVQASKAFRPRLSVEMVDDDAFRVFLPADCTGMAYLDNVVLFTEEGIYLVTGDGPDVAGVGSFFWTRLPFNVGCVNPRSVKVTDAGVFFESARGMCLLPRGFADPIPQDQVMDTLAAFPHITAGELVNTEQASGGTSFAERTVQWTVLADDDGAPDEAAQGRVLVYDIARQAWGVDTFQADVPGALLASRDGQRLIGASSTLVGPNGAGSWHPFRLQNLGFADGALAIPLLVATGDMRFWGTFAHGLINRIGLLGVLESAHTLSVTKTTDKGTRATTRGYTGVAPDYVPGATVYLGIELGGGEQRDITALRLSMLESSAAEGMSLIGFVVEADAKPQGFRLLSPADRIN